MWRRDMRRGVRHKSQGFLILPGYVAPRYYSQLVGAYEGASGRIVFIIKLAEKLGKVREETEKSVGRVLGICWLLKAERRQLQGKTSSSVVIYLERPSQMRHVWLGKRRLRAEQYNFDRGRDVEMGM